MTRNVRSWWRRWLAPFAVQARQTSRRQRPSLEVLEDRYLLSAYVVTSTADSGTGSLRDAINQVNAGNYSEIDFNIGASGSAQTITPLSALPTITANGVYINGGSQSGGTGSPLITLNGVSAGSSSDGFLLDGSNCTVSGLLIDGFSKNGIEIGGTNNIIGGSSAAARNVISGNSGDGVRIDSGASGNQVLGDYIGTDASGASAVGNVIGVLVIASANTIGGTTAGYGNVISGNNSDGVVIFAGSGVQVQGNDIGTDVTGTKALGNGAGILVSSSNNTVGGTSAAALNVISGNRADGVVINSGATGVQIQGNYIGTDVTGSVAVGNSLNGVEIQSGANDTIGGTATGAGNVISGNNNDGISIDSSVTRVRVQGNYIGTNAAGNEALSNNDNYGIEVDGNGNTIGGTIAAARNVISGNGQTGLSLSYGTGNLVQGNFVGINAAGTSAVGNGFGMPTLIYADGIGIGNSNNTIGGTTSGARNIVSGNHGEGLFIDSFSGGVLVQGNYIGTNAAGTNALGNGANGIYEAQGGNTLGGTAPAARNVISGNGQDGIELRGSHEIIEGNYVGTNAAGNAAVGNGLNGIGIEATNSDTIGGTVSGARNIISGNSQDGIFLNTGQMAVEGNFIGTNAAGTAAVANGYGIETTNFSSQDTLGGTVVGARNVISGNGLDGVLIDSGSTGNLLQGNFIGTNFYGTAAVGNGLDGVQIVGTGNTIGGSLSAGCNVISGNGLDGLQINSGATGNQVQGNEIGTNAAGTGALGNLDGVEIGGSDITLGSTVWAARNVISGNSGDGVLIDSAASGIVLQGNIVGANVNSTAAVANYNGVEVRSAKNTLGGTTAAARNIVAGNANDGVLFDSGGSGNLVQGNYIGLSSGGSALGNGNGIEDARGGNTIGGTVSAVRNIVSANSKDGVLIDKSVSGSLVQGNFIGTNAAGLGALGNSNGVEVAGFGNTIGSTVWTGRNVLAGNTNDGVLIDGGSEHTLVEGNVVGANANNTAALANKNGVEVAGLYSTIGGVIAGQRNIISSNADNGVLIDSSASETAVQNNLIGLSSAGLAMGNGGYGVSIAGNYTHEVGNVVTDNAVGGTLVSSGSSNTIQDTTYANGPAQQGPGIVLDSGANNNLAAPVLSSATLSGTALTVTGTFNAPTANVTYWLYFYANPSNDPEGKIFLGRLLVTPTTTGTQSFTFTTTTSVTGTDPLITATLTDNLDDTSAFSAGATTT